MELPAGLTVRTPTGADHARVLAVLDAWWGGIGGEAGTMQRRLLLPRLFFDHFSDTSYVVDRGDEVAAFLVGFHSPAQAGEAYIHFVGVAPDLRGAGLGRLLYQRFFTTAAARGRRVVRCITSTANTGSVAFHTSMGFAAERVPDYDGPGVDRVTFRKELA